MARAAEAKRQIKLGEAALRVRVRLPLGKRVHVARGVPAAGFLQRTKLSNTPSVPTVG